jgi:hypothetical protein
MARSTPESVPLMPETQGSKHARIARIKIETILFLISCQEERILVCTYTPQESYMSTLNTLKLVATKRPGALPQIVQRRNRLIAKIWEQTELAKAQQEGKTFQPTRFRSVKDAETGERRDVESPKHVRAWWFTAENGKLCIQVRYGAKTLELAKGKTAIEVGSTDNLIPTLEALKAAVAAGELDAQIEAVSETMRSGFAAK